MATNSQCLVACKRKKRATEISSNHANPLCTYIMRDVGLIESSGKYFFHARIPPIVRLALSNNNTAHRNLENVVFVLNISRSF